MPVAADLSANQIGGHPQHHTNLQPERLDGLAVDDKFELHQLLDRQVGRLGTVCTENLNPGRSGNRMGGHERAPATACCVHTGAGKGIRTLDPNLGKVVLYP